MVVLSNVGPYINSVVLYDELAFSLPPLQRIVRLLNNQKKNARSWWCNNRWTRNSCHPYRRQTIKLATRRTNFSPWCDLLFRLTWIWIAKQIGMHWTLYDSCRSSVIYLWPILATAHILKDSDKENHRTFLATCCKRCMRQDKRNRFLLITEWHSNLFEHRIIKKRRMKKCL